MILHHVPQLAGRVKIIPAALYSHLFSHCNLDMINGIMIPVGSENRVCKAQGQQVQNCFFAEVMIDPVHLVLAKDPGHGIVDFLRAGQISADGFFQHHPGCRGDNSGMIQAGADFGKERRGH